MSKAKDNPESFNKDYQSLLSAAKVSNNFLKRIEESVLVSRSRRAIKPLSTTLTSVILMVENLVAIIFIADLIMQRQIYIQILLQKTPTLWGLLGIVV
ncbi:hypothetical protein ACT691_20615 [Vibrio metschnikovii]